MRLLGAIAARGDPSEHTQAEVYYLQALALAEELGMRPLTAHSQLGLGTLYSQMGQLEKARAALSTAIALYRAMEMTSGCRRPRQRWRRWEQRQRHERIEACDVGADMI